MEELQNGFESATEEPSMIVEESIEVNRAGLPVRVPLRSWIPEE
jgi:hypothetical protein